ncbi:hypothetical protein JCM5296_002709 [Sporobolomyces johnsonii]
MARAHLTLARATLEKVTTLTVAFYPHRQVEFEEYCRWFSGQVSDSSEDFTLYHNYVTHYRRNFGGNGFGHDLKAASKDTATLLQWFARRGSSSSTSSSSHKKSRGDKEDVVDGQERQRVHYNYDHPSKICAHFNEGVAHKADEYGRRKRAHLIGTTSTPRLRRSLFFPSSTPSAPSLDCTLSDAPLPSVPPHILRDHVIAGTITAAPHLFDVSTPLKVDVLQHWLAPHPNRELVHSILSGLREGFWPGFEGDLDHSSFSPPLPQLIDQDHDFIAAQLNKDFEDGYLSEPFSDLLPGMVVSPTFVGQSVSGLNDGVSKQAAHICYDMIAELARLMRHHRLCGNTSSPGVVWKLDVSGAFRLEFPLVYVDDTFGYDVTGKTSIVQHPVTGESRLVPFEQGTVLVAWKLLSVPWDWKKQESGVELVVLGHFVDTANFTISLPPQAKSDFIALVRNFVTSRERPLVEWWCLTSYAQWAASTSPFIKFALASSYAKTTGKSRHLARIKLNQTVQCDLTWLADELETAPPLDILDPALEEWGKGDAGLVPYSDACL